MITVTNHVLIVSIVTTNSETTEQVQAAIQSYRLRIETKSKFAAGKAFNMVVMSWGFSVEMAFITIQQQQLRGLNQICH